MQLIEEFLYRVKTTGPLKTTKGSPNGERNYWIVSEAELEGPNIKARIGHPAATGCVCLTTASGDRMYACLFRPTTVRPF